MCQVKLIVVGSKVKHDVSIKLNKPWLSWNRKWNFQTNFEIAFVHDQTVDAVPTYKSPATPWPKMVNIGHIYTIFESSGIRTKLKWANPSHFLTLKLKNFSLRLRIKLHFAYTYQSGLFGLSCAREKYLPANFFNALIIKNPAQ